MLTRQNDSAKISIYRKFNNETSGNISPNLRKLRKRHLTYGFRLMINQRLMCETKRQCLNTVCLTSSFVLFLLNSEVKRKKIYCVGRESNPDQLLGRQLCWPLYHRRCLIFHTEKIVVISQWSREIYRLFEFSKSQFELKIIMTST